MKNLQLLTLQRWGLQEIPENAQGSITHAGCDSKNFYFISNGYLFGLNTANKIINQLSEQQFNNVISFDVLEFDNKIIIGNGEVLSVFCIDTNSLGQISLGSTFEALCYNPTQECLIVYYADGRVSNLSLDYINFEIYNQEDAHISDDVPLTVYVGWGSENTQFQGPKGRIKPEKVIKTENVTNKKPRISWRGNGEMFVVNYWKDNRRFFKVFELPCNPVYECQDNKGLQAAISWRPEGNMIAMPILINDQYYIMISEKNGQKRFDFQLDHINEEVAEIMWSPCSKILAVHQTHKEGGSSLNLFTTSNYKWYLKQHLFFPEDNPLKTFFWNSQLSSFQNTLVVVTDAEICCYTLKNQITGSVNYAACAVIDGKNILWSFFNKNVICPPLANVTVELPNLINFISFHPTRELAAVVTAKNELIIFTFTDGEVKEKIRTTFNLDVPQVPLSLHTLHWLKQQEDALYFIVEDTFVEGDPLIYKLESEGEFKLHSTTSSNIVDIIPTRNQGMIELYLNKYEVLEGNTRFKHNLDFIPLQVDSGVINEKIHTFILTVGNKFYVDDTIVSEKVTSFIIRGKYLLITVSDNKLYCIPMNSKEIDLLCDKNLNSDNFFYRNIEQGAIIVSTNQNSASVILQMPRGNIEVISCIFIAIDMLEKLLTENKWKEAVYFVRTEKLDWNLLVDLNPGRFLLNINKIIEAGESTAVLSSICIDFIDENVLNTKYKKWADEPFETLQNKRQVVCQKILDYLEETDYTNFFNLILFINVHHFSIRQALEYLQDLMNNLSEDDCLEELAASGVKLLKVYVLDDKLYSEALKMYDLKLARYIASFSQMDPKIYDPQLQKLSELPEVEKRYEINLLLKNYNDAVIYLLRMPNVDRNDLRSFIKKHGVSKTAYNYVNSDSNYYKEVASLYAENLSYKGLHLEAASVLVGAGLLEQAMQQYKTCLEVDKVETIINLIDLDVEKRQSVYEELADKLTGVKKYVEAARVYYKFLNKNDMALEVLLEGQCFEEAINFSRKIGCNKAVRERIIADMQNYAEIVFNKINDLKDTFNKYKTRLSLVRALGEKNFDDGFENDCNQSDLFSDAGSQTSKRSSNKSRSSTASSKLRRKQARKVQDLREGGVYEDIALVKALHQLIIDGFSLGKEIRKLCLIMIEECNIKHKDIREFHNSLVKLQDTMKISFKEIWPEKFNILYDSKSISEMVLNKNIEFLDEQYRIPPATNLCPIDWRLSIFE